MTLLITPSDISAYKQIAQTPHIDKYNEQIRDAQLLDIRPLLGLTLYNKVLAAPSNYQDLLNGGEYIYQGNTYTHDGLKMVIAYYAYARIIMFGDAINTPSGMMYKTGTNSESVDGATRKSMYSINREGAAALWETVRHYLLHTNNPDFIGCNLSQAPRSAFRSFVLGRD